jgi:hypothetical protein
MEVESELWAIENDEDRFRPIARSIKKRETRVLAIDIDWFFSGR